MKKLHVRDIILIALIAIIFGFIYTAPLLQLRRLRPLGIYHSPLYFAANRCRQKQEQGIIVVPAHKTLSTNVNSIVK